MEKITPLPPDVIHSAVGTTAIETFDHDVACPRCDSTLGHIMTAQAQYATGRKYACHGCLLIGRPTWNPTPKEQK